MDCTRSSNRTSTWRISAHRSASGRSWTCSGWDKRRSGGADGIGGRVELARVGHAVNRQRAGLPLDAAVDDQPGAGDLQRAQRVVRLFIGMGRPLVVADIIKPGRKMIALDP